MKSIFNRENLYIAGSVFLVVLIGSVIALTILVIHYGGPVISAPICASGPGWQVARNNTVNFGKITVTGKDGRLFMSQTNHPENFQTFEVGPAAHPIEMSTIGKNGEKIELGKLYFAFCNNQLLFNTSQYSSPSIQTIPAQEG